MTTMFGPEWMELAAEQGEVAVIVPVVWEGTPAFAHATWTENDPGDGGGSLGTPAERALAALVAVRETRRYAMLRGADVRVR